MLQTFAECTSNNYFYSRETSHLLEQFSCHCLGLWQHFQRILLLHSPLRLQRPRLLPLHQRFRRHLLRGEQREGHGLLAMAQTLHVQGAEGNERKVRGGEEFRRGFHHRTQKTLKGKEQEVFSGFSGRTHGLY